MSGDPTGRLAEALAGRYRIQRELGQGGMATVYLAEDVRHHRRVALKLLRPELAAVIGAERFLAEIRVTANLQHPHILPLHDSGEADGLLFYVMPFIEGVSLRERLNREKQLPVQDAVRIASEVASALDYAHRQGVIHRDIKPENILFHDGRAVVADFGIALAATSAGSRMTETGMSLGTPFYMSPEQATGERTITPRSDIYALGAVLYEMLVGEPPFTGPTAQAIVAKVLTTEPAGVRIQRRSVPPHVEAAVMQALEKLPADRFNTAAEFAAALANPSHTAPARAGAGPIGRQRMLAVLPWLLLAVALGLLALQRRRGPVATAGQPVQRFSIVLPEGAGWIDQSGASMALSRDGRILAYTGRGPNVNLIYLRHLDRTDPVPVPGSENGGRPILSPDGRWLGFIGNSGLLRAPVAGGPPETLCRLGGYFWLSWLENNQIVFADGTGGLRQCSLAGEVSTLLANDSSTTFNHPHGLPGDRGVLFTLRRNGTDKIAVLDLKTGQVKPLEVLGSDPRYVGSGHLVYVTPDGTARVVPFDLESLTASGDPVVLAQGVPFDGGAASMAVSLNGVFITPGSSAAARALELVDRSGRAVQLIEEVDEYYGPRFSPDGRRIAVSRNETTLWVLDRAQQSFTRLPLDGSALRPAWSPDGRRIAYVRQAGAKVDLRIVNADGSAQPESLLVLENLSTWHALLAPDGRSLVVRTVGGPGVRDIWLKRLDSAAPLVPLLQSAANEISPSLSPDGKWLAYNSNESGRFEVYVRAFPGMESRYQISVDGGTEPMWSPRGNEIFYRNGEKFITAEVRTAPAFEVIRRTILFTSREYGDPDGTYQDYDVSPDGRSFVMVRNLNRLSQFLVTLNLFDNPEAAATGEVRR
jgi:Tol biopolymer transport system component/tRNA A-37 threonylcarbamoyl transferase component Bud32